MEEQAKIDMKLSLLMEEKDLVMKHLNDQDTKHRDVVDVQHSLQQRANIVRSTVSNLQLEIEKLKMLLSCSNDGSS